MDKLDLILQKLDSVEAKVDSLEKRMDSMEKRMDNEILFGLRVVADGHFDLNSEISKDNFSHTGYEG